MERINKKVLIPNGVEAIEAEYIEQEVSEYKNNPLIEALPPIYSRNDVIEKLLIYPEYNEEEREFKPEIRVHCIQRLFQYFQPLSEHIDLESRFSRVIRQGYLARNPIRPEYAVSLRDGYEMIKNQSLQLNNTTFRTTASGFTIIGISGIGKTTTIQRILTLYPQVIVHSRYKNQELSMYQIAWLKLDCPYDGSLKGLCIDFFLKVDSLLGTNYYKKYGARNHAANAMLPMMAQIAKNHSLGVLIIDEIQHLSQAHSGGAEAMLNFFVTLVNTIGVPTILIGTMKAISVLQGEFRQARRGSGQGDMVWDRMKKDKSWDLLIKGMWEYQWVKNKIPLTDELIKALYEESQGIIDLAVKLYAMSQIKAITLGKENITPQLIEKVAGESFKLVRPMINALKSGNIEKIIEYADIRPIDINAFCAEHISKIKYDEELKAIQEAKKKNQQANVQSVKEKAIIKLMELDVESGKAKKYVECILKEEPNLELSTLVKKAYKLIIEEEEKSEEVKKVKKPDKIQKEEENDLRTIVDNAKKNHLSAYEVLKEKGCIKPPMQGFLKIG